MSSEGRTLCNNFRKQMDRAGQTKRDVLANQNQLVVGATRLRNPQRKIMGVIRNDVNGDERRLVLIV